MKDTLCIIINGAGTTGAELSGLKRHLDENDTYFVYYPDNLPGSFVGDYFPKATIRDFNRFIEETMDMMRKPFKHIYVIGYSLGAATASVIAARSGKVDKLVLIAPIVKNPNFRKFFKGIVSNLTHSKNITKVQKLFYNEFLRRFQFVPKTHIWTLQRYFWYAKRYIRKVDDTKILIIETLKDEIVKTKSIDWLEKKFATDRIERYPVDSSHFLFFDRHARKEVYRKIDSFLKEEH